MTSNRHRQVERVPTQCVSFGEASSSGTGAAQGIDPARDEPQRVKVRGRGCYAAVRFGWRELLVACRCWLSSELLCLSGFVPESPL